MAAIAIPQLLGFQERAREQADKQTAVQVRNAIALLYANGEISGTGTVEVSGTAGTWDFTAAPTNTTEALIEELTGNITVVGGKTIRVVLGADGEVTQSLVAPVATP